MRLQVDQKLRIGPTGLALSGDRAELFPPASGARPRSLLSAGTSLLAPAMALLFALAGCGPTTDPATSRTASREEQPAPPPAAEPNLLPNARLPHQLDVDRTPRPPRPDDWFEDVAERAGIRFAYRDGCEAGFYQMLEMYGGGVALFDYDRDGDVDVFLTGGGKLVGPPIQVLGRPSALFRNDGSWQFTEVTREAGLDDDGLYTHGASAGDFDRDGYPDLLVAGFGGLRLYHNQQDGSFADVTESSGLESDGWNILGAWADIDRDGWLDLYILVYSDWQPDHTRLCQNDNRRRDCCGPTLFDGNPDHLFRNRGDGTFEEISEQAGLLERNRGLGIVAVDLNDDDWIDLYVGNDAQENYLYLGGPKLPLRSDGVVAGVAFSASGEREGTMGVDVGDFDGDGLPDLWWCNFASQDNSLARRVGNDAFYGVADVTGMVGRSRPWTGFGTGFGDFDSDGWLDIFIANGHVCYESLQSPSHQPAQLFRNEAGKRFVEISEQGGPYFSIPHAGRGGAIGDLDNDGAPDLVISRQNDPVAVLRNRLPAEHWVRVELRGTTSNPDAVGAKVTARYGERILVRWLRGGGGYASYFDPRILLPATDDAPVDVTVKWPSGKTERFNDLAQKQTHVLIEGEGQQP